MTDVLGLSTFGADAYPHQELDEQAHKESLAAEAIKFAEEADGSDDDDDDDDDEVHKEYLTNMVTNLVPY